MARETNVTRIKGYLIRLTDEERDMLERARRDAGVTLAAWMRRTLLAKAQRQLSKRDSAA